MSILAVITIFETLCKLLKDPIGPVIDPKPGPIFPKAVIDPDNPITTSFSAIVIINAPAAKIKK